MQGRAGAEWFHRLAQVEWKDLKKGDILLRKVYGNENVVRLAQKPMQARLESYLNERPNQFVFAGAVRRKGSGPDDGFEEQLGNLEELYGLHKIDPRVVEKSVEKAAKKAEARAKEGLASAHEKAGRVLRKLF